MMMRNHHHDTMHSYLCLVDNHAVVALLKEKMCTVGTFSSEAQKYCMVSDAQNQYQQLLEPPKAIYKSIL